MDMASTEHLRQLHSREHLCTVRAIYFTFSLSLAVFSGGQRSWSHHIVIFRAKHSAVYDYLVCYESMSNTDLK